jgi:thiamine kinase-like enzyme
MTTLPASLHNLQEIRTNQRFATFKALNGKGQPVFVKQIRHKELSGSLRKELYAIERIRQTAKTARQPFPFLVPQVLQSGEDYLVTNWVEGDTMPFDVTLPDQKERITFLAKCFSSIDQATVLANPGLTNYILPGKNNENMIQRLQRILPELDTGEFFDPKQIEAGFNYARQHAESLTARFTHADLTPNNIIEHKGKRTLIDWESAGETWPRFYDIVNMIYNWSLERPELRDDAINLLREFFAEIHESPKNHLQQLNTIAMGRALSCITELISEPNDFHNTIATMTPERAAYIRRSIDRILAGRLFIEI